MQINFRSWTTKKLTNKLMLTILMLSCCTLKAQNDDCASPTEYIMQFLRESGTLWKGDQKWEKTLKNNTPVHTNFAKTHSHKYFGLYATILNFYNNLNENNTIAKFEISLNDTHVKITSHIKVEVIQIDENETTNNPTLNEIVQEDNFSRCNHKIKASTASDTNTSHVTLVADCESKIPYKLFMQKMSEYKK